MGMFSTLNYLIDAPLAEILTHSSVCGGQGRPFYSITGRAGMLYDPGLSYEHADWERLID